MTSARIQTGKAQAISLVITVVSYLQTTQGKYIAEVGHPFEEDLVILKLQCNASIVYEWQYSARVCNVFYSNLR